MDTEDKPAPAFDFEAVFDVDDYLYFYADFLTEERTAAEVAAIVALLDLRSPAHILDLACGFGRHANRLAALGHHVTGVDLMPGFLEIARRDAGKLGLQVDYIRGDMRQINFEAGFDVVLLVFTAFGYFEDEGNLQVLKNVGRALKPGGRLIFDIHNRDTFLKDFLPYIVTEKEGNLMIDRSRMDSLTGKWHNDRIVIRDGIRKDKPFFVRMYNPNEINSLVQEAGLVIERLYGTWDGQPLSGESRRMIVIAQKPVY